MAEGWGGTYDSDVDNGREVITIDDLLKEVKPLVETHITGNKHVRIRVVTLRRIIDKLEGLANGQ